MYSGDVPRRVHLVHPGDRPGPEVAESHVAQIAAPEAEHEQQLRHEVSILGNHVVVRIIGVELLIHLADERR